MMKKIIKPLPNFQSCVEANDVQKRLDVNHATKRRGGKNVRTLAGSYKLIRPMPLFSGLGDFIILAQCVEWMTRNKQSFTRQEVASCLKYFEDYSPRTIKRNKEIVEYLVGLSQDTQLSINNA